MTPSPSSPRRSPVARARVRAALAVLGVLAAAAGWLAVTAAAETDSPEAATGDRNSLMRLREGTALTNRAGRFRQDGDALTFVDEAGRELGGLANLGLERVLRALKGVEDPESVWWTVSGTVTEFNGRNYILISRAVYRAAALPPALEHIAP
ncbi:MAG TPA: hypothetical protein PJ982_11105 [Lacipirellulaceae bacterium]|nr:hypothetical protein [Lacipirellulaceae bacterium]